jgi:hypothetical protein
MSEPTITKPSEPEPEDEYDKVLRHAVCMLMEHFDTVQVFATKVERHKDPDSTINSTWGRGNWFARYGQIKTWLDRKKETDIREWIGGE